MSTDSSAPRVAPAWRAPLVVIAIGSIAWWALPDQLGLLTRIAITAPFVLSLDLVVGIAGLATLGHAALFGAGAYAAGLFALKASGEPLIGLAVGAGAGALLALASGAFLLRYHGFTFLMHTVAVVQIVASLAQKARDWTGGDDGLTGFAMAPLLGRFAFDLEGRTAALYALAVLAFGYYVARRVVDSPFGLAVRGIHENRARMAALGTPVMARLLAMYTLAGALAGAAGALSADQRHRRPGRCPSARRGVGDPGRCQRLHGADRRAVHAAAPHRGLDQPLPLALHHRHALMRGADATEGLGLAAPAREPAERRDAAAFGIGRRQGLAGLHSRTACRCSCNLGDRPR
jgi:branched-chain amino acid transport system permease protein